VWSRSHWTLGCVVFVWRYRSGQVLPYDDEAGMTRRRRRKKSRQKVIQTQTSPARKSPATQRSEAPRGTLLSQPPAVFVTDATPETTPRDRPASSASLPGAVDDEDPWAKPYQESTPSSSEPVTSRGVTPSGVGVTATARGDKKDLSAMLPDVNDSAKNAKPG